MFVIHLAKKKKKWKKTITISSPLLCTSGVGRLSVKGQIVTVLGSAGSVACLALSLWPQTDNMYTLQKTDGGLDLALGL